MSVLCPHSLPTGAARQVKRRVALALAVLAGTVTLAAAPAPAPNRTVIRPGRLLDVRTGQLRTGQAVVVEGGRIARVAASGEVPAAPGDTTIDLPEATLLPGLIDMHTHLTFELELARVPGAGDLDGPRGAARRENARRTLEAGFTTVRNLGARDYADVALRDAIDDGDVIGPRIVGVGPGAGHHGRALRREPAAARVSLPGRRRGGRRRGSAAQGARGHQVRRGRDQGLRDRRGALEGRRPERLAVHARGDEGDRGGRPPARAQGGRARARGRGRALGLGRGRRLDRARAPDGRRGDRHPEEERHVPGADAVPRRVHGRAPGARAPCPSTRSRRCARCPRP